MLDSLLIHPNTKRQLIALAVRPPQGLLLLGAEGLGKRAIALAWAQQTTAQPQIVEPDDKGTIGIETIRELYRRTRAKHSQRLVLLIDHAETMGIEAQNAFLKLLEEPQAQLTFVLTATGAEQLLPTIVSRVQRLHVLPLGDVTLGAELSKQALPPQAIAQILFAAAGRPAVALRLANGTQSLEAVVTHMQQAKVLLGDPPYQRLLTINELAKNRETTAEVLRAMLAIIQRQVRANANTPSKLAHWITCADAAQEALGLLRANGNPKATLLQLCSRY